MHFLLWHRTAKVERKTNETDISVEINLDGTGKHDVQTGIGFLDHMFSQMSKHGRIDLTVRWGKACCVPILTKDPDELITETLRRTHPLCPEILLFFS